MSPETRSLQVRFLGEVGGYQSLLAQPITRPFEPAFFDCPVHCHPQISASQARHRCNQSFPPRHRHSNKRGGVAKPNALLSGGVAKPSALLSVGFVHATYQGPPVWLFVLKKHMSTCALWHKNTLPGGSA